MLARALRVLSTRGAILCYHGISGSHLRRASGLHVSPASFETAVAVARELGEIIPAAELVRRQRSGKRTARLFAITFDDAYASLALVAPFITAQQVPVTIFAVADALDDGRRFWWDRIDALAALLTPAQFADLARSWGVPDDFASLHHMDGEPAWPLRQWIVGRHAGRWPASLEAPLQQLEAEYQILPDDRSTTWNELSALAASHVVDVGVHTLSHAALPALSQAEQVHEIGAAFERLSERFQQAVPILAAPYGYYDRSTLAATQATGLLACLGVEPRTFRFQTDPCALPRFSVVPHDGRARIAFQLSGLFDRIREWRGDDDPRPLLPSVDDRSSRFLPLPL